MTVLRRIVAALTRPSDRNEPTAAAHALSDALSDSYNAGYRHGRRDVLSPWDRPAPTEDITYGTRNIALNRQTANLIENMLGDIVRRADGDLDDTYPDRLRKALSAAIDHSDKEHRQ